MAIAVVCCSMTFEIVAGRGLAEFAPAVLAPVVHQSDVVHQLFEARQLAHTGEARLPDCPENGVAPTGLLQAGT